MQTNPITNQYSRCNGRILCVCWIIRWSRSMRTPANPQTRRTGSVLTRILLFSPKTKNLHHLLTGLPRTCLQSFLSDPLSILTPCIPPMSFFISSICIYHSMFLQYHMVSDQSVHIKSKQVI